MKKLTRRLGRFTSQERAALIDRYRISDLTQKQFAEENQIRLGTFQQWLMRERRKTSLNGSSNGILWTWTMDHPLMKQTMLVDRAPWGVHGVRRRTADWTCR